MTTIETHEAAVAAEKLKKEERAAKRAAREEKQEKLREAAEAENTRLFPQKLKIRGFSPKPQQITKTGCLPFLSSMQLSKAFMWSE
jgi:hypothetical protein